MNAAAVVTGIGPMVACAKGPGSLTHFEPEQLWGPQPQAWFDPKVDIGGRGYKYVDTATCYLFAAIKQLDDGEDAALAPSAKGMIVGSNSATRRELEEMYRTVFVSGAEAIAPMRAPLFCPNMGVGAAATKQQAKALNITLMNPMTAGLEAVALAARAIAERRASSVLAGAMEDDGKFTLGQFSGNTQAVATQGGAWVIRLGTAGNAGSSALPNGVVARIGGSLNRFVPRPSASGGANVEALVQSLSRDFAPLFDGAERPRVSVAALTDTHSRFVVELLQQVFAKHGIEQVEIPSKDTDAGTLLALAQLSWHCMNSKRAVCIAVSPLGHLIAVEVLQAASEGKAT